MTLRKLFVVAAAIAALGVAAGAALAQTPDQITAQKAMVDAAKAQGTVGEQADGFLGFRTASSNAALTQAVQSINAGRRAAYAQSAVAAGVTPEVAGARMFEGQLMARISSGQWYRNAQGQWVQR